MRGVGAFNRWSLSPEEVLQVMPAYTAGSVMISEQKAKKAGKAQSLRTLKHADIANVYRCLPVCQETLWKLIEHVMQLQNTPFGPNVAWLLNVSQGGGCWCWWC